MNWHFVPGVSAVLCGLVVASSPMGAGETVAGRGAFEARLEVAREVVSESPADPRAWGELGMVLHVHGLEAEAVAAYTRAMQLAPDDARWPELAARASPDPDRSLQLLERAHALDPEAEAVALELLDRAVREGRVARAEGLLNRTPLADATDPQVYEYVQLAQARLAMSRGDAAAVLDRMKPLAASGSQNADVHRLLAQAHRLRGEADEAREAAWRARSYGSGLRRTSGAVRQMWARAASGSALLEVGRRLLALGDAAAARVMFEEALRLDPQSEARVDLGHLLLDSGAPEGALAQFEEARRQGHSADATRGATRALLALGRLDEAARRAESSLGETPRAAAHELLGKVEAQRSRPVAAAQHFELSLGLDPTRFRLLEDLAAVREAAGDPAAARLARRKLARLAVRDADNLRALAWLDVTLGDLEAARETFRGVVDLRPDDSAARFNLAMLLAGAAAGEALGEEAVELAQELVRRNRRDPEVVALLSLAYAAAGRHDESRRAAERLRALAGREASLARQLDQELAALGRGESLGAPRLRRPSSHPSLPRR